MLPTDCHEPTFAFLLLKVVTDVTDCWKQTALQKALDQSPAPAGERALQNFMHLPFGHARTTRVEGRGTLYVCGRQHQGSRAPTSPPLAPPGAGPVVITGHVIGLGRLGVLTVIRE